MRAAASAELLLVTICALVLGVTRCDEPAPGNPVPEMPERPGREQAGASPDAAPLPHATIASARVNLDEDGPLEAVEIRADVELAADGEPIWEDGHRWVVLIRDGSEEHRIVDEFVPQGRLTAWVVDADGSAAVLVLEESGTAGIELRAFRHEGGRGYVAAGGYDGSGRIVARLVEGEVPPAE